MNNECSLISILRSTNEDFISKMAAKTKNIKQDKEGIIKAANEYAVKYEKEVEDGTQRRRLLIENGKRRGLSEEESLKNLSVFIPDKKTPILNMLHFLLYEYPNANDQLQFLREETNDGDKFDNIKEDLNKKFGGLEFEDIEQDIPEILEFIYENVTTEIFKKAKKLKALSRSDNKEEAFLAYSKCIDLCKKYDLDFDKLPCNID